MFQLEVTMAYLPTSLGKLPVRYSLAFAYASSFLIALLMAAASAAGLFFSDLIYPSEDLKQAFVANDVVNLFFGLPLLLGAVWLARSGKLIGLLFWPGMLLFVLYTYLAYAFGVPFNVLFLVYLLLVALSAYTVIGLVAGIDGAAVKQALAGAVSEKAGGGVLVGLGILFTLRNLGVVMAALNGGEPVTDAEAGVLTADFLLLPAWIIGGVLLWRREALGYAAGAGLLFQASSLFIGLIFFLILQPMLSGAPFALTDVVVVFIFGLVCFIPFGFFLRGAIAKQSG
jgi:hypothetical protein